MTTKQSNTATMEQVLKHFDMLDTKPLVDILRRFDEIEPLLYARIANAVFDAHRIGQERAK